MTANRADRRHFRQVAKRPPARTVTVELETGDYAGWGAIARADFPAGMLADLQSADMGKVIATLEIVIVEHNMPGSDGKLASSLRDVDPYGGLLAVAGEILTSLQKLPPR